MVNSSLSSVGCFERIIELTSLSPPFSPSEGFNLHDGSIASSADILSRSPEVSPTLVHRLTNFQRANLECFFFSLRSRDAHPASAPPLRLSTPPTSVQTPPSRPKILLGRDHMAWDRSMAYHMGVQALLRHGEWTVSASRGGRRGGAHKIELI